MNPLVHNRESAGKRKIVSVRQSGTEACCTGLLDRSSVEGSSVFYDPIFFDIPRGRLAGIHSWCPTFAKLIACVE